MVDKIFFNSSLPRSGSTLLQNIMAQNPDFYVTPTSGVFELLYAAQANYRNSPEFKAQDSETMEKGWKAFCHNGMFGFFNSRTRQNYYLKKRLILNFTAISLFMVLYFIQINIY